jgi:hypothetical protein
MDRAMRRAPDVGDWISIKPPEGYELEMDVSHPHGKLRHRLLPDGGWREGNVPSDPSLEEIIGQSITIEGENQTDEAREFLDDFDAQIKAIDPASDAPKGSADR